jgi:hypothetical protein
MDANAFSMKHSLVYAEASEKNSTPSGFHQTVGSDSLASPVRLAKGKMRKACLPAREWVENSLLEATIFFQDRHQAEPDVLGPVESRVTHAR